ncbi:hypothetical protein EXIGLDRAFT_769896 [Exidia glandulosa HHB12029]|uniref:F-box domain-containing protein n=1 Tax=Exidia glandulosa HHB12029 TaxID=1314781 RepID=A0A165H4W8_EXIGL|nr:hypothetical protein EXIGLDRAFT_769896 [Exidia glandulosa HHB12029]
MRYKTYFGILPRYADAIGVPRSWRIVSYIRPTRLPITSHSSLSAAHTAIYALVGNVLQEFSCFLNNDVPVNSVPAEIFIDVLSHLTFHDLVAASHVCQLWRSTAINDAALWANVITRFKPYVGASFVKDELIRRTRDMPLDLEMYIGRPVAVEALGNHLHHVRRLTLNIDSHYEGWGSPPEVPMLLMHALRKPAPLLEEFSISFEEVLSDIGFQIMPADVFAGQAPRLRTVAAVGMQLPFHPYAAFENVQRFVSRAPSNHSARFPFVPVIEMVRNIGAYRGLKHLVVLQDPVYPARVLTETSGLFDTLRDIAHTLDVLELSYFPGIPQLMHALRDGPPQLIIVHTAHPSFLLYDFLHHLDSITSLRFGSRGVPETTIEVTDSRGNTRRATAVLAEVDAVTLWRFIPGLVFDTLTSLSLHEHMWPDDWVFPTAVALQDLRVFIGTHDVLEHLSGIFQLGTVYQQWQVPSLRRFTLASISYPSYHWPRDPQRSTMLVAADDVRRFLHERLAFSQLPILNLEYIALYEAYMSGAVESLRTIVTEITNTDPGGFERLPLYYQHIASYASSVYFFDFL